MFKHSKPRFLKSQFEIIYFTVYRIFKQTIYCLLFKKKYLVKELYSITQLRIWERLPLVQISKVVTQLEAYLNEREFSLLNYKTLQLGYD